MLTDVELTILGVVAEGARYVTEIKQVMQDRRLREWLNIGTASVDYVLEKLHKGGLLTATRAASESDPGRTIYQITESGLGILHTAFSELLRQPRSLGTGFELGLANIHVLKPSQVSTALTQHLTDLQGRRENLQAAVDESRSGDSESRAALYSHNLTLLEAEIGWLENFLKNWNDRHVSPAKTTDEHNAPTVLHRRTQANFDKQVQVLNRPKRPVE